MGGFQKGDQRLGGGGKQGLFLLRWNADECVSVGGAGRFKPKKRKIGDSVGKDGKQWLAPPKKVPTILEMSLLHLASNYINMTLASCL